MPALTMLRKICYEKLMDLMMYGEVYLKFDAKVPTENVSNDFSYYFTLSGRHLKSISAVIVP